MCLHLLIRKTIKNGLIIRIKGKNTKLIIEVSHLIKLMVSE